MHKALFHSLLASSVEAMQILDIQTHSVERIFPSMFIVQFLVKDVDHHGLMLTMTKIEIKGKDSR